jgi:hypothetical protein
MHKLLYAILIVSRKLRHYFQAHKIVVVTSYPLRAILHNTNATGNIAKWAAELASFQLDFQPRHAIKSQSSLTLLRTGLQHQVAQGVRTMGRTLQLQKPGLRCSPDLTGRSSSMGLHATRRLGLAWSSLTQTVSK